MKIIKTLALGVCLTLGACATQPDSAVQTNDKGTQWEWKKGTIVVKTPERPNVPKGRKACWAWLCLRWKWCV